MTEKRKPGDEGPIEAWDDEGGADEREREAGSPDDVDRAKRWSDEHTEHWHGAKSSDATEGRAGKE